MIIGTRLRDLIRGVAACGFAYLMLAQAGTAYASTAIIVLGDSISAAFGMTLEEGWVALLDERLQSQGLDYHTVNASISGDTTAGGLRRLPNLLAEHNPAIVVVELGGNDGLRGYPIPRLRDNLTQIVTQSQAQGAQVLILGMEIPPNFGERYTGLFRETFPRVAKATGAHYGGFLLADVALNDALMQADGIHPTAEAQPLLLDHVWGHLAPLL